MSNDVSLLHYFTISLDHFTISPSSGIHPISFFPAAMGRKPAQKDGQPLAKAFAKGAAAKQKAPAAKTAPKTNSRQDQASLKVLPVVPEFGDTASKEASGSAPHQAVPPAKRKEFAEGSKDSFGQALAAGASDEGHLEPHKRLCLESAAQTAEKAVIEDLVRAQLDKANQEHQSTGLEVDTGAEGTISKSSSTALGAVGAELGNNDEVRAAVAATEPSKGSNEKCPDVKPEVKPSSPPQEGKSKNPLLEETQSAALAEAKNAGEEAQAATVEKKDEDPASSAPLEPTAEKDDALSSAVKVQMMVSVRIRVVTFLPFLLQLCRQVEEVWPMNRQNMVMLGTLRLCSNKEKRMSQWTLRRKRLSLQPCQTERTQERKHKQQQLRKKMTIRPPWPHVNPWQEKAEVWPMHHQNRMMLGTLWLCSNKEQRMPRWTLRRKRLSLQQLEISWTLPSATGREFCKSFWR